MHIPGEGARELYKNDQPKVPAVTDGQSYPWITRDFYRIKCAASTINGYAGESFVAVSPQGIKYHFNHGSHVLASTLGKGSEYPWETAERIHVYLRATKVEDRFGNYVDYNYSGNQLTSITSSDGRSISITYANGKISQAVANNRTWTYSYRPRTMYVFEILKTVGRPDGSSWNFGWVGMPEPAYGSYIPSEEERPDCPEIPGEGGVTLLTMQHPSGAVGEFSLASTRHRRDGVPGTCIVRGPGYQAWTIQNYFDNYALVAKKITGSSVAPLNWAYDYETGSLNVSQVMGDCIGCNTTKDVIVVDPDGTTNTYRYGVTYGANEGQLLRVETKDSSGTVRRIATKTYMTGSAVPSMLFTPVYGLNYTGISDPLSSSLRPVVATTIAQDSVTYSTATSGFDAFARAGTAVKSNTLGHSKTDVTEYHDNLSLWVIGQPRKLYNVESGNVVASETIYNPLALPVSIKKFGKPQQSMTYNADGTLATVANGAGNTTTLSSWKRGIPRLIQYPITPEAPAGATESAVVDDNGWITSTTDENSYVHGYGYDTMGRLASIVYPTGDTGAWLPKAFEFRELTASDSRPPGISVGQWRHYEGQGNFAKFTYFDAMWRPVLVQEYDTSNAAATIRYTRTAYESKGQVSFQSYPVSDPATATAGVHSFYDALDRVISVQQDSEQGVLTTTTEYLAGLQVRVTNPRNLPTTTSFMAWDQPGYDLPVRSDQPENKVIEIARHPQFGWPLQLKQRSADNSLHASRQYVYDGNAQLCKTIEPETGVSVMDYDAAGNLAWQASGLSVSGFSSTTDCQRTAANGTGLAVTRLYDARNRLTHLTFPGGRGNQIWTYEKDNLPASVTAYNDTSNTTPVLTAYAYNKRRLLTGETLSQPGWYSWSAGYQYNPNGHLSHQVYPTGLNVNFAPNALGQPTQAGSYAAAAQYFPNGTLKQFTYGNGIVHTMTQNARQLPARVTSSGNVLDFGYDYDKNANPTAILDYVTGTPTAQHRWMTYDGLDRLITSAAAMFGGSDYTHRFTYDALDNIESWKHAGVKDYADYIYDAQNRLTSIRNTAGATVVGLGYDSQGNVANKNGQLYEFDYGNRLRNVQGKESYRYDGLGRRVQTTKTDGTKTTLWQYSQAGQMLFSSDWDGPSYLNQKTHEYVYLGGSLIATIDHAWPSNAVIATKYQHTDALGSPVAVTNEVGAVIELNNYEPYGAIIGNPTRSGIGYTGHVMDGGTALTYMQQRYYDPSIGRFLSADPVAPNANTGALFNRYDYAKNNPYRYLDPDGRTCTSNADKKGVTCRFDNPNGLAGRNLDNANRAYTRAVNRLLHNPSRKVELSASSASGTKVSTTTTAGKIADVLIKANVKYGGDSPALSSLAGGKANAVTDASSGGVTITMFSQGLKSESAQGRTMIHEGAHGTVEGQEVRDASNRFNLLRSWTGAANFQQSHQQSFKGASVELFDKYDK